MGISIYKFPFYSPCEQMNPKSSRWGMHDKIITEESAFYCNRFKTAHDIKVWKNRVKAGVTFLVHRSVYYFTMSL